MIGPTLWAMALVASTPAAPPAEVAVPVPSAAAIRYHSGNNVLWAVVQAWSLALPAAWLASGAARRLGRVALRVGRKPARASLVFLPSYMAVNSLLTLPLAWWIGFDRQHRYGLSTQGLPSFLADYAIGHGATLLLATISVFPIIALAGRFPGRWWLIAAILAAPAVVGTIALRPIVYDPMFNTFGPMVDKPLEARLLGLAARAGIDGGRVYQVDMGRKTTAVNAYVTGLFGSRRIVLWDTLLAKLDADEVAAVMGHEMGHYALGHVARGVWLACLANFGAFAAVAVGSRWACRRLGVGKPGEPATLPLIHLVLLLLLLAATPVGNAISRHQEREADRYALGLTGDGRSAARAFADLQRDNLSVPRPGLWYTFWRGTHPPLAERIEAANAFGAGRGVRGP